MIGFIIAVIAGFLTPQMETTLAVPVARVLEKHITLENGELRLLAFILMMLLAGIASSLMYSGSTFWVILGGALGYFGTRIVNATKTLVDKRKT